MKSKRIMSFLLSMAMTVSILSSFTITALAEETQTTATEKNITLGTSALKGGQQSNVYFGNYKQSSNDNGGYNIDPIKWRVLDVDNDYDRNAKDGETDTTQSLFLLADQNLDVFQYNTAAVSVTWETGTMRSWLNGYDSTKNGQSRDYTNDNFIDNAFSSTEQKAIAETSVVNENNGNVPGGNNTEDQIFLLSIAEVQKTAYGFTADTKNTGTRVSTDTAYVATGGKLGISMIGVGKADYWWLRSPGNGEKYAAAVTNGGSVNKDGSLVLSSNHAVRPAFNLNLSSVLFTVAAVGGKSTTVGLQKTTEYTGMDYKLTLKDSSRKFKVNDNDKKKSTSNKTVTVGYSGAVAGDSEYISAIITAENSNDVLYYGSVAKVTAESGTITVTLPSDIAYGRYALKLFNEQINGDYKTDFSSDFETISLTVAEPSFSIDAVNVTNSTTTATVQLPKAGDYTLIFASYTSDVLGNMKIIPIKAETDNTTITTDPVDIVLGAGDKVMLWDNFEKLTPMCDAYIVK